MLGPSINRFDSESTNPVRYTTAQPQQTLDNLSGAISSTYELPSSAIQPSTSLRMNPVRAEWGEMHFYPTRAALPSPATTGNLRLVPPPQSNAYPHPAILHVSSRRGPGRYRSVCLGEDWRDWFAPGVTAGARLENPVGWGRRDFERSEIDPVDQFPREGLDRQRKACPRPCAYAWFCSGKPRHWRVF